jgi:hypothetical protein
MADQNGIWLQNVVLNYQITGSVVPLPGSLFILGSGLLGLVGWRRFRKN